MGPADLRNLLPVRSPGLTVGDIAGSALRPRCWRGWRKAIHGRFSDRIGCHVVAVAGLHRNVLERSWAVGMLVQAETEADVRRVAEVAQGLSITLGSGNDLALHWASIATRC